MVRTAGTSRPRCRGAEGLTTRHVERAFTAVYRARWMAERRARYPRGVVRGAQDEHEEHARRFIAAVDADPHAGRRALEGMPVDPPRRFWDPSARRSALHAADHHGTSTRGMARQGPAPDAGRRGLLSPLQSRDTAVEVTQRTRRIRRRPANIDWMRTGRVGRNTSRVECPSALSTGMHAAGRRNPFARILHEVCTGSWDCP